MYNNKENNNNYITIKEHHKCEHGRKIAQNIGSYSSIFQDLWWNSSIFKAWNSNYQIPVYSRFSRMCTNPAWWLSDITGFTVSLKLKVEWLVARRFDVATAFLRAWYCRTTRGECQSFIYHIMHMFMLHVGHRWWWLPSPEVKIKNGY